jgi:hypothetical protein
MMGALKWISTRTTRSQISFRRAEENKLVDAVRASGYPLQSVVARELSSQFTVIEEWGYKDKTETSIAGWTCIAFLS